MPKIFISYSRADAELCDRLLKHLRPLERTCGVTLWSDRSIDAGTDWRTMIRNELEQAEIIVLLISADFMASDFIYSEELSVALGRLDAAKVVPVLARPCNWETANFSSLQMLPRSEHEELPVTSWPDQEAAP